MALEDKNDYDTFINENQKLKKLTKNMSSLIINIEDSDSDKEKPKTKKAKKSTAIEDILDNFVSALQECLDNLTNVLNLDRSQ
ncbi:21523_t:CDS:2 [Racocetra persica]|uniref:21523_t:CDS:1 n=1 Tax=Racocetra persica TaxID=160502 RepID=A0ACA9LYJ0_9GLOM|nr:21523_t:CDS:2 [Racocetra persica]